MLRGATASGGSARRRVRWQLFAGSWLVFLAYPLANTVHRLVGRPVAIGLALLGYATFCAVYVLAPPHAARLPQADPRRYVAPVVLFALALAMTPLAGGFGLAFYTFVVASAVALLPVRGAVAIVAACFATVVAISLSANGPFDTLGQVYSLLGATLAVGLFSRLIRINRELVAAREELARLAVAEERVRFARDLHDILGHSLTVITVKAGLARRLVQRDPARAEAEVAEIERLGRAALGDVRATVAGYRQVTLAGELASARYVLEAAGIRADLPHAIDAVPGPLHELFGWVVREGVTNVVRHSRADTCAVRVWAEGVEVRDDGKGGTAGMGPGSGLAGLAERVAAVGGRLIAGTEAGGGFRLRVTVPACAAARAAGCPQPAAGGRATSARASS
jgi:two-component system, NarL family, sensor histidine kinase DesK